jgi:exodeoxyribonuclease VII large subunit
VDVIIVARGGGSIEDLAPFNQESVARAIVSSMTPVISAVGHETDFTIADFVADLRAPTPSAAAELVIESRQQLEERVAGLGQRLARGARYRLLIARQAVTAWAQHSAFARLHDALARRQQRLDDLVYRMISAEERLFRQQRSRLDVAGARIRHFDLRRQLAATAREIDSRIARLGSVMRRQVLVRRSEWERSSARLQELSPLKILDRGYALVFDSKGRLLKDAADVNEGDEIFTRLARGTIISAVKQKG